MNYDVYLLGPRGDTFRLATGVGQDSIEVIKSSSVWPIKTVESDPDEAPEYTSEPTPLPASRYMVWMQYPAMNGKVPWGLVARDIPPEELFAWTKNMTQRLSVQPMSARD